MDRLRFVSSSDHTDRTRPQRRQDAIVRDLGIPRERAAEVDAYFQALMGPSQPSVLRAIEEDRRHG